MCHDCLVFLIVMFGLINRITERFADAIYLNNFLILQNSLLFLICLIF